MVNYNFPTILWFRLIVLALLVIVLKEMSMYILMGHDNNEAITVGT